MSNVLGIVGAGKLGIALARAAVAAGLSPLITSSDLEGTKLIAEVMAPGTRVGNLAEVAEQAEVIVLAVPLHRFTELPRSAFDGKVVVDAINHWQPADGEIDRFGVEVSKTSLLVQAHFAKAHVVKSLNQLGYHDVDEGGRPRGAPDRLGVAAAGDNNESKVIVMNLIDRLGFDPVDAGTLDDGARLGPGGPAFGAAISADEPRRELGLSN